MAEKPKAPPALSLGYQTLYLEALKQGDDQLVDVLMSLAISRQKEQRLGEIVEWAEADLKQERQKVVKLARLNARLRRSLQTLVTEVRRSWVVRRSYEERYEALEAELAEEQARVRSLEWKLKQTGGLEQLVRDGVKNRMQELEGQINEHQVRHAEALLREGGE